MTDSIDSPYIRAAGADTFSAMVLDNSRQGPVLVNFWSRKAGPCLRLYPVLDKVVHHYQGRVLLVNVDVDAEIALPKEYGVTSVPTLKLFRNGHVVATLHGYQSETDLTKLLDLYVVRDSDRVLAEAVREYGEGHATRAYDMIVNAIVEDAANPRLPLAMCKLLRHEERYSEALQLIDSLPPGVRDFPEIARFRDLLEFLVLVDSSRDRATLRAQIEADPEDLAAREQLVAQCMQHGDYEAALQELVAMLEINAAYRDNLPQKMMRKVFGILGEEHPLVAAYRPRLKRYRH